MSQEEDFQIAEIIFGHPRSYYDCPHIQDGWLLSFCACPDCPRFTSTVEDDYRVLEWMRDDNIKIDLGRYWRQLVRTWEVEQRVPLGMDSENIENVELPALAYRPGDYSRALLALWSKK